MGLLSSAGAAAQSATSAVTDSAAGGLLDAVAGGLTGQSGAGAAGAPHYVAGDPLDPRVGQPASIAAQPEPVGSDPGTQARSGSSVPFDRRRPLQYVHCSHAHDDHVDNFAGMSPAHGIAMRHALIREDVLVYSFARAAQRVLEQAKASKGAAGAMLATAGSLLGGSTQAAAGPEAIDPVLDAIRAAADPVNVAAPGYPEVHDAGVGLAEAWATLHETCKTALDPAAAGGLGLPSIPGLSALAGGAGIPEVVAKLPEWLFKVQDAYQAMYRASREAYEWDILKACHDYSLLAIRERRVPGYDIWFLVPDPPLPPGETDARTGAEKTLADAQRDLRALPMVGDSAPVDGAADALGSVQTAIRKARKTADEAAGTAGDITGWLGTAESEQADLPAGSAAALAAAFAAFAGRPQASPPVPALGSVLGTALGAALLGPGKPLPGFLQTYVGIVGDITLVLLPKIYSHLHGRLGVPSMPMVLAACHDAISGRIVDLVWALIFGKGKAPGRNDGDDMRSRGSNLVGGLATGNLGTSGLPGADELANKAADLVRGFIRDQGHYLDFLVEFVAADLHAELVAAEADCAGRDCLTMEVYLGRLPMLAALLGRNLVFPVFNLLLKVFGMADAVAGQVWNPVDQKIREAGALARGARDAKDDLRQAGKDVADGSRRAEDNIETQRQDIQDQAGELGNLASSASSLEDLEAIRRKKEHEKDTLVDTVEDAPGEVMDAARGDEAGSAPPAPEAAPGTGPISAARVRDGAATPVDAGQIDAAVRVTPEKEADAIAARSQPPAAVPAPAAPALPALPF